MVEHDPFDKFPEVQPLKYRSDYSDMADPTAVFFRAQMQPKLELFLS